jgi:hypothetical protein
VKSDMPPEKWIWPARAGAAATNKRELIANNLI